MKKAANFDQVLVLLANSVRISKHLDGRSKLYLQVSNTMANQFSSIKDSIKDVASAVGRFIFIGSTAFGIASYANFNHHESYWNGTIERVQTVDFNMLSHMLPSKLSQALIAEDEQEIQRTLDSNYGLFGLVVTNCRTSQADCNQTVQYVSDSKLPWRSLLNDDTLAASTYDVLRDPPPLYSTGSYADSRDPVRDPTGLTNPGRIIGRVYYVRGVPPGFLETYSRWIKAWPSSFLSDSGANRYYSLTTILFGLGGLSAWIFMELGFSKRRRQLFQSQQQQRQLELAQTELIEEAEDLRQQLQERVIENSRLIDERSQSIAELKIARKRYQSQEVALRASSQKLQDELTKQEQAYVEDEQRQTDLQTAIQQQQRAAELLKKEIINLKAKEGARNSQSAIAKVANLEKEQAAKQKVLDEYTVELKQVWQELNLQTEEKEEKAKLVEILNQQIEESERQQASASIQQQENRRLLQQAEQEKERGKQRIRALEEKLKDEKEQGNQLRTLINDINPDSLNIFERKIVNTLKNTTKVQSAAWSIHTQLDVSSKGRSTASMLTDCIVIGNSFIAVIEAKNYSGKIYTEGDTRNSAWLNLSRQKRSIEIASCWGNNPYKQVSTYVQSAMSLFRDNRDQGRTQRNISKDVSFYGIVVFPDNADFSSLDTDLGNLYRVTHLKNLVDVLHELERQTQKFHVEKGIKGLSSVDIKNCLYGNRPPEAPRRSVA